MLPLLRRAIARPSRPPTWRPRAQLPIPDRLAARNWFSSSTSSSSKSTTKTRLDHLLSRLPRRLQPYASRLRSAPLSHVVAFLVLHEITAVVPLLSLWALFHYTDYVPLSYVAGHWGAYVRDGVTKAERYFRRKGWFGFSRDDDAETLGQELAGTETAAGPGTQGTQTQDVLRRWATDDKYRVVVEVALAWAVTKALLPLRIVVSVWATPWFAGVMGSARRLLSR